jgi:hypothetical protein
MEAEFSLEYLSLMAISYTKLQRFWNSLRHVILKYFRDTILFWWFND